MYGCFTCIAFALIISINSFAQCPTVSSGEIDEGDVTISGTCVLNEDILIKSGNITVTGSLTINGNLEYDVSGTTFLVDGGSVTVTATFTNKNSGNVTITNSGSFSAGTDGDTGIRFDNQNSGTITVSGNGSLTVYGSYFNNGSGTTSFLDGTIDISNNFDNNGNGTISSGGVVKIGGNLTQNGSGNLNVTGGLTVGGTLTNKDGNVTVSDEAVIKATTIDFDGSGSVTIEDGGTIAVDNVTGGTITNDAGNADQDCSNGCCGAQCDASGTMLNEDGLVTLPVELLYFTLETTGAGISIQWATASVAHQPSGDQPRIYPSVIKPGNTLTISGYFGEIHSVEFNLVSLSGSTIPLKDISNSSQLSIAIPQVREGIYMLKGEVNGLTIQSRLIIR